MHNDLNVNNYRSHLTISLYIDYIGTVISPGYEMRIQHCSKWVDFNVPDSLGQT